MRGYGGGAPKVRRATTAGAPENVVFRAKEEPEEGMVESACESAATMAEGYVSPEEERHRKLLRMLVRVLDAIASRLDELPTRRDLYRAMALAGYNSSRMLGHVKDAIASRLDELPTRRDLYRAMALAGYNSSTNPNISGEDPGLKAIWAKDDAEALLALGSEETG